MKKVLLGLSGGIDSAVAAHILKEQGFLVTGCFLLLTENSCENSEEVKNAAAVAEHLGIKLITADFRERFRKNVSDYFIKEYLSGKTPNPCIRCNPTVKIKSLIDTADSIGADFIATGHYALTERNELTGETCLKAAPSKKDQSYFLYRLSPLQLDRIIFPLGNFSSKDEVRLYGEKLNLPNAKKPDSQEICFIPDDDYVKYICNNSDFISEEGNFLDNDGNIIGRHSGIINYTVGQRKGLGAFGEPRYVKKINAYDNTVTLCKKDERFTFTLKASDISWSVRNIPEEKFTAKVKVRSTALPQEAEISVSDGIMTLNFTEKVLAPSPGQSAVIYDGDKVLGGGIIL